MRWFDFVARWMSRPVKDLAIECAGMTAGHGVAVDDILRECEDRMRECDSDGEREALARDAAAEIGRRSKDLECAVMLATVRAEFRVKARQLAAAGAALALAAVLFFVLPVLLR